MIGRLRQLDAVITAIPIALMGIGITVIYTLTFASVGSSLAIRQAIAAAVAVIVFLVAALIDHRAWFSAKAAVYCISVGLLLAVPLIGTTVFGAKSWIMLGPLQFQPSEIAKVGTVLFLAGILQRRERITSARRFFAALAVLLIPIALIMVQPDFGTMLILTLAGFLLFLHAELRLWQKLFLWGTALAAVAVIILSFANVQPFGHLLKDYQKDRLSSFIDPQRDPSGSGYNVLQSKIAVGSGGLVGRGLGFGSQSQLNFIPVVHTDFIFAGIAEAWGFSGALLIVGLFGTLIFRIYQIGMKAKDQFGYLVCAGTASFLTVQLLVNVGMNIGIMPVTGIPLPFVSFGGTALIMAAWGLGIVASIARAGQGR